MDMSKKIKCSVLNSFERLDIFLFRVFQSKSRSYFQHLIKSGYVLLNGEKTKPSQTINRGDLIEIVFTSHREMQLKPIAMKLDILYEDNDIIVINKPPFQVVHPGAGNFTNTLVHGLLYYTKDLSKCGGNDRLGIVHRLDKDTSGIMVIARHDDAHRHLSLAFKKRKVKKRYLALVWGTMQTKEFVIDKSIDRSRRQYQKMRVVDKGGKRAITHFHLLRDFYGISLLEIFPYTGRTHQLRVHLSYLNLPILGDSTYGNDLQRFRQLQAERKKPIQLIIKQISRQMLHASTLEFEHPISKRSMKFVAPLALDFVSALKKLNRTLNL